MDRNDYKKRIAAAFKSHSVVGLLGPRQCGKTTLAKQFAKSYKKVHYFDLENMTDLVRMESPLLTLEGLEGLIVIDEIQRKAELFQTLRVLVDKHGKKQKYLILGSASRELIRQSSETLAGRIRYVELTPFKFNEVGELNKLWLRGGYPKSFLARGLAESIDWRKGYIQTFLEKDIPQLGFRVPSETLRRFWVMLTHYHGNIFNASDIGKSLGEKAHTTVQHYLNILVGTFMIRRLRPWYENVSKSEVKSPKIYFRDSGLLHTLMRIESDEDLKENPKLGASWEGFAIEEIIRALGIEEGDCYFWAKYSGAEIDLMIHRGSKRIGYEFKYTDQPRLTKSLSIAKEELQLNEAYVIYPGEGSFPLAQGVRAYGLESYLKESLK